jgi:hypothetical protein
VREALGHLAVSVRRRPDVALMGRCKYTIEMLAPVVAEADSYADVLRRLGSHRLAARRHWRPSE